MAGFMIVNHFKGGTKAQYETTLKAVHPADGLPKGQTYHAAGPAPDGWTVIALWDSEKSWNDFRDNTLLPALAKTEGVLVGPPDALTFSVDHLETT